MKRPTMEQLPAELACAARAVAGVLGAAGHRTWLVGGAVRDLALEIEPQDADLASAALPEEIEALFSSTHAVGRAFGTVVVRCGALDLQVTTFRAEGRYEDARRPSQVRFATSLMEDAARRDFTCNALYLDPLNDEFVDPTGGMADLAARRLRCVGQPAQRFSEDGLRLLRLARLAAQHELEIEEATCAGARASLESLRGVSPERVLAELSRMADGTAPARAAGLLLALGVLERLPGLESFGRASLERRVEALGRLEGCDAARFFGALFWPDSPVTAEHALERLWALRPSRALQQRVGRIFGLAADLVTCLSALVHGEPRRSSLVRLVRAEEFEATLAVWSAWHPEDFARERELLRLRAAALPREQLSPPPLVTSAELARAGLPPGPLWAELLRAGEDAQLEGELRTLEEARAWIARRMGTDQVGGKTRRKR